MATVHLWLLAAVCVFGVAESAKKKGGDDLAQLRAVQDLNADNYKEAVESRLGWLIHFGSEIPDELSAAAEKLEGLARVGFINVDKEDALMDFLNLKKDTAPKFRAKKIAAKKFEDFEELEEAQSVIADNIPDDAVQVISEAQIQTFVSSGLQQAKLGAILLSDTSEVPKMLQKLSNFMDERFNFAVLQATPELVKQFGGKKTPYFVIMVAQEDKEGQSSGNPAEMQYRFGPVPYNRKQFGGLKFANALKFMATIQAELEQTKYFEPFDKMIGKESKKRSSKGGDSNKIVKNKPLFEYTAETPDACESSKLGLCVIALLDGSPPNKENFEAQLEHLKAVQQNPVNKGRAMHFMYVDVSCHASFAEYFGMTLENTPSIIAVSPKKAMYATHVGAFEEKKISKFISGVLGGKQRIGKLPNEDKSVPLISAEDDCAAIHASLEIPVEEDSMDDDIMAEMLAEEEARRKASEEEQEEQPEDNSEMELKRKRAEEEMARLNKVSNKDKKKKKKKKNKKKKGSKKKDEL
eukprot:m.44180 g.44180  ORF g.44180 m.44180 type:complete len:523 (-) comp10064_c0_seq1:1151-2719(-)